jgi:hypothetical protein
VPGTCDSTLFLINPQLKLVIAAINNVVCCPGKKCLKETGILKTVIKRVGFKIGF